MTTDQIVESMAEAAHNAWMAYYVEEGHTSRKAEWGEEFMVPFDKLSNKGKELDRIIMRSILGVLSDRGLLNDHRG